MSPELNIEVRIGVRRCRKTALIWIVGGMLAKTVWERIQDSGRLDALSHTQTGASKAVCIGRTVRWFK